MDIGAIQNIVIAIVSGLIPALLMSRANNRKTLSEAKKINAESREIDIGSLSDKLTLSTMKLITNMESKVSKLEDKCAENDETISEYASVVIEMKETMSMFIIENTKLKGKVKEQAKQIAENNSMSDSMAGLISSLQDELSDVKSRLNVMVDLNLRYRSGIMVLIRQLEGVGIKPEFIPKDKNEN